ncbi:LytTR family DNA-binding domain-containing protein [Paenibacillus sp. JX-17]|uniref:LytTR family DNA-binding domain-containing protein n=1 Tax=Paenibacillus lacisoli TaxID=3064525 RepID=A0ABT9CFY5_9BACL|nr:LytTR family DNA-binding domain-containing protein [Paenibacillus sp. JX-17]MDO7908160.1 LytTR family DNA-binding domain-containing protein [Paenibacillus sp. JX-17]
MKAIIVEDEFLAREELEYLIRAHSSLDLVGRFEDGLDVLKFLQEQQVDVIFLDINIPSLDGMLLARNISQFARKPYIIFTTAYKEHAAQAFELEAFDYILKPYDERRIAAMLQRLESVSAREAAIMAAGAPVPAAEPAAAPAPAAGEGAGRINLWKDDKIIVTDADDIYYAEAREKVTVVYTRKEQYSMPMSITEFHSRLPQEQFFRCHRSYTVNLRKIHEIVPWFNNTYILRLLDLKGEIPVSRSRSKEFRQIMRL